MVCLTWRLNWEENSELHFHTGLVVLLLTAGLLVFGTVTSLWTEYNNPGTIGNLSLAISYWSVFRTVSKEDSRGFASIDYTATVQ